jgi:hypothetical protein
VPAGFARVTEEIITKELSVANSASHEAIGLWITIAYGTILGMLSVVWLCRQLYLSFNPRMPVREGRREYVTREELSEALGRLEHTITGFITRAEHDAKHRDVSDRVATLDKYMHERIHDVLEGQQVLTNQMSILIATVQREIGRREGQQGTET